MNGGSRATDCLGMPTGAAFFRQARAGCRDDLAQLMGTTEDTVRNRRQRIRCLLEHLLPLDTFVEYSPTGGNQHKARDIQLSYPHQRKPDPL